MTDSLEAARTPALPTGQAEHALRLFFEAYDSGNLQMSSPEIGEPENNIPLHPWHEEWLYNARNVLASSPTPQIAGDVREIDHDRTYLRGWNEGIGRAIELLEADGWVTPTETIKALLEVAVLSPQAQAGDTITGIDVRPGEDHETAFRRYCDEDHRSKYSKYRVKFIGRRP